MSFRPDSSDLLGATFLIGAPQPQAVPHSAAEQGGYVAGPNGSDGVNRGIVMYS